jgi:hypothetical protein
MRQAIHIFRKDVRHCWPYIAATLSLTALNAWQASTDGMDTQHLGPHLSDLMLIMLMVLAWWLAIGAAIHGESAIGDRQFWTTRPYSWKSLLAAKLLFVAAFLALPMLLSDCAILLAAGYNPLGLSRALVWRQCWFLAFLVLPIMAAALTRVTRDLVLTGLAFYVGSYLVFSAFALRHAYGQGAAPSGEPSWIAYGAQWLVPVVGLCLIAWQYAQRRTTSVRVFALALAALVPLGVVPQYLQMSSAASASPWKEPAYSKLKVELSSSPPRTSPASAEGQIVGRIGIPVRVSGWPRELMNCQLSQVTVTSAGLWPGDPALDSNVSPDCITTNTTDGSESIDFSIDGSKRTVADRVDLSVSITLRLFEHKVSAELRPEPRWTHVPGFGTVRWLDGRGGGDQIAWRVPLLPGERQRFFDIAYTGFDPASNSTAGGSATASVYNLPASFAWFRMSPLNWNEGLFPMSQPTAPPATFTVRRLIGIAYRELRLSNVRLADYATGYQPAPKALASGEGSYSASHGSRKTTR